MKFGILTFHRSINYGAVTQCYALATRLQEDFPDDVVEVIDYNPSWRKEFYKPTLRHFIFGNIKRSMPFLVKVKILISKTMELIRTPSHYTQLKKRYRAFSDSITCLPLSCCEYRQSDAEEFRKAICGKYDVIIVGSDCVWEWSTIPLPSPYYLYGDFGAVKTCFAASAGTDDQAQIQEDVREKLKSAIEDFSFIGLRDSSTEYNVKNLCPGKPYYHTCDPTTFLDIKALGDYREQVRKKMIHTGIDFNKPIVCVMGNEKIGKLVRAIFGKSVQVVGVYVPNRYCDVFFSDLKVLQWATMFGLCDLTFTTFFHGTMLSLVNHTPVLSFDYLPETEKQYTKLHELYNRLDLTDFYHRGKKDYEAEDIKEIGEIAKRLINAPPKERIAEAIKKEAQHYDLFKKFLMDLHGKKIKNEE